MNKKQKLISFELVVGVVVLVLAASSVFDGKTGVEVLANGISSKVVEALEK